MEGVWEEAEAERENMKESLEMVDPVSKPKTSEAVGERVIGEPLRVILRKEMKLLTILLWKKPPVDGHSTMFGTAGVSEC